MHNSTTAVGLGGTLGVRRGQRWEGLHNFAPGACQFYVSSLQHRLLLPCLTLTSNPAYHAIIVPLFFFILPYFTSLSMFSWYRTHFN